MNKTILLHTGPWGAEQLHKIAEGFDASAHQRLASLYWSCDDTNLPHTFANLLSNSHRTTNRTPEASDIVAIKRCRLLRNLSLKDAMAHWVAINQAWSQVLDNIKPIIVISELIDSYIIDSLKKECDKRDIPFFGLVTCFVNGYFRVTTYGEYRYTRDPSEEEVKHVTQLLTKQTYSPQFITLSDNAFRKQILFRWAKNIARVIGLSAISLVPRFRRINMVYGGLLTARKWLHMYPKLSLGQEDWKQCASVAGKPIIYVPLQHVPEATIDYWCHDVNYIDYERTLLSLIKKYSQDFSFVIKEHPNVIGLRNPDFYNRLLNQPGVTFSKTTTSSNDVINACDAVLVWTGSVGFEAALRGKPVLSVTSTYYMSGNHFMVLNDTTDTIEVVEFIKKISRNPITREQQFDMVRHLLSGLVEGRLTFSKNSSAKDACNTSPITIGAELRKLYERWYLP